MFERLFRRQSKSPGPVVGDLRRQALEVKASALGLAPTAELPHVFGAIMETGYFEAVATLVAFADGAVSLYFSNGGGVIGAGGHQAVRDAAGKFLKSAEAFCSQLQAATETPVPIAGRTRFYIRTFAHTLTAEAEEQMLGDSRHPLSPLFYAAHEVITRVRQTESGGAPARQ